MHADTLEDLRRRFHQMRSDIRGWLETPPDERGPTPSYRAIDRLADLLDELVPLVDPTAELGEETNNGGGA